MQLIANTAISASCIILSALGFRLIYTTAKFFHFAHATSITIGAYTAWVSYEFYPNYLFSTVVGVGSAALSGYLIFAITIRPLVKKGAPPLSLLLASLAILIVVQHVIALTFGEDARSIATTELQLQESFDIFGARITLIQLLLIVSAISFIVMLWMINRFTLFGRQQMAVAEHRELSAVYGINTEEIEMKAVFLAAAFAGLLGVFVGTDLALSPGMGITWLLPGVIAVIVGGVHSIGMVVIASIVIAILKTATIWYLGSAWQDVLIYSLLLFYFIFNPHGASRLHVNTSSET